MLSLLSPAILWSLAPRLKLSCWSRDREAVIFDQTLKQERKHNFALSLLSFLFYIYTHDAFCAANPIDIQDPWHLWASWRKAQLRDQQMFLLWLWLNMKAQDPKIWGLILVGNKIISLAKANNQWTTSSALLL